MRDKREMVVGTTTAEVQLCIFLSSTSLSTSLSKCLRWTMTHKACVTWLLAHWPNRARFSYMEPGWLEAANVVPLIHLTGHKSVPEVAYARENTIAILHKTAESVLVASEWVRSFQLDNTRIGYLNSSVNPQQICYLNLIIIAVSNSPISEQNTLTTIVRKRRSFPE